MEKYALVSKLIFWKKSFILKINVIERIAIKYNETGWHSDWKWECLNVMGTPENVLKYEEAKNKIVLAW